MALVKTAAGDWEFGPLDQSIYSYNLVASSALESGELSVCLTSGTGDFYIWESELTYNVPEPAILLLLGSGILGIGIFRKRYTIKKK